MIDTNKLRAKIYGEYRSQADFSKALGWDANKISRILRKTVTPNIDDCAEMASKLKLSADEYLQIFLPSFTPFGDKAS